MDGKKTLFRVLAALYGLCFVLSWVLLLQWEIPVPVPVGTLPLLAMAGAMSSGVAFGACTVLAVLIYGLVFVCLWGAGKGKRWASAVLSVLMILDLVVNVIFTVTSWWYLLAIGLDAVLAFLVLRLSFRANQTS